MRDLLNLRIVFKHRDVEICRLFRLIIEPQHWSNSLHASYCAPRNAMQRCDAALAIAARAASRISGSNGLGFYRLVLRNFLELAALAVFPDPVPGKALTVYGNVNSGRQRLHERECAAQIEEAVGTAKGVGDHRSG